MDKTWILSRLIEPSTWRGLAILAGALGIGIAPELVEQIGVAVTAVIGAIEIARREQ